MKKGDVVAWKRPLADLICTVQGVEGDTVSLRYLHAHKNEPLFVAKVNEVVRLSGPQEEGVSTKLVGGCGETAENRFSSTEEEKGEEG